MNNIKSLIYSILCIKKMWRKFFTFFLKLYESSNIIYLDLILIILFLFVKKWDRSIDTFFQYN
jgi:hypothetical protein